MPISHTAMLCVPLLLTGNTCVHFLFLALNGRVPLPKANQPACGPISLLKIVKPCLVSAMEKIYDDFRTDRECDSISHVQNLKVLTNKMSCI